MSVVSSTRLSASNNSNPQSAVSSKFSSQDNSNSDSNSASDNGDDDDSMERPAKRFKSDSPESGLTNDTSVDFAEHQGQRYFVGDHVLLEDVDNSSGTLGTDLPA
ncbi:hypothetical protein GGH13_007797, partial [Coemansia sp. S155-1]